MPSDQMDIGNVQIVHVSDGLFRGPAKNTFPDTPDQVWRCGCSTPSGAAVIDSNIGSFFVRSQGKVILVDTGAGHFPQDDSGSYWGLLLENMDMRGLRPEEVDIVFMTHMHFDHVGWNIRQVNGKYVPTFPKAKYIASQKDWDFLTSNPHAESNHFYWRHPMEAIARLGLMDLLDGEHDLTDELKAFPTPGHTPGHMSILISSQGEKGLILGDVAHHPLQVHETDWLNLADVDHDTARETRRNIMKRVEEEGLKMAAGHFPAPGFGIITRLNGKRYWQAL